MTIRNWGFAAGLAAALALVGTAEAQSQSGTQPGGTADTAGTSRDTPGMDKPREGAGMDTNAGGSAQAAPGAQGDTGSTGSAAAGSTGSAASAGQKIDKDLKEKIQKIHASNKAEIHMAQMGAERAQSPEVKQFAEKLQRDHTQLDERLTAAAQTAGVELSGKDYDKRHDKAMKDMGKLEKKSGQEFDREFMSHMVKDHEKDLKDVRSAARDAEKGNHTELASVLSQAQTGMQGHKDEAERIHDSLKKGGAQAGRTGGMGSTGAEAGSTGAQDTPSGGAEGTSSDRVGERGGDTGQSRGDLGGSAYGTGSTGAEAGSTGTGTGAQDTPSGGAEGTSSDRPAERGGDTGATGTQDQPPSGERR